MSPDGHDIEQNVEHVQGRGFGHVIGDAKKKDEAREEDMGHDLISFRVSNQPRDWSWFETLHKGGFEVRPRLHVAVVREDVDVVNPARPVQGFAVEPNSYKLLQKFLMLGAYFLPIF